MPVWYGGDGELCQWVWPGGERAHSCDPLGSLRGPVNEGISAVELRLWITPPSPAKRKGGRCISPQLQGTGGTRGRKR